MNQGLPLSDWFGIRVYTPHRAADEKIVWIMVRNPPAKPKKIMTIGVHAGHAFLIKDIKKLGKIYQCAHCAQQFTKACNLQRHHHTCKKGETTMIYPQLSELPQTAFRKVIYPKSAASKESLLWLKREAKRRGIHIHHARCEHGGERWLPRERGTMKSSPVDGYKHETRTVFQYHGCRFHGCTKCFPDLRDQIILNDDGKNPVTPEELYQATVNLTAFLRKQGYEVIEACSCEVGVFKGGLPKMETKTYPHVIIWDTETFGDKKLSKRPDRSFNDRKRAHTNLGAGTCVGRARRCASVAQCSERKKLRMVQPGAGSRIQLGLLRVECDRKVFCGPPH